MRRKLIEADVIECVLGLGPNLFYNSPMEACVVICCSNKPKNRKGRILFINAVNEVTRERAQSFLTDDHIERVVAAYRDFKDELGFTRVATLEEIRKQDGNLNISMYIAAPNSLRGGNEVVNNDALGESLSALFDSSSEVRDALNRIFEDPTVIAKFPESSTIVQSLPSWLKRCEWKRLQFGEFADSIGERVEPVNAAEEIYVGLDDLDSGSLHIRRWGKGSDVIGTKLRFRKGDIIFGRRRAYQRKLSVAVMDGICSAHAMVVRAKPQKVLPEFLPFLMMSDKFMNRAVEISVGSLSPTINWTTLKKEEFDLPPLDQQRRIAEILWALDDASEGAYQSRETTLLLRKTAHREVFVKGLHMDSRDVNKYGLPQGWQMLTVGEACLIENRLRKPINALERSFMQGEYPYYGPTGILDHLSEYRVDGEFALIGEDGDHFLKFDTWNMTQLVRGRFNVNNHAHLLRGTDKCSTEWIFQYFKHRDITPFLSRQGSGRMKLQKGTLEKMPIAIPPHKEQNIILEFLRHVDACVDAIAIHHNKIYTTRSALLNQLLV